MPSPHQKNMRPPMNGPNHVQPGQPGPTPIMRAMTPQQQHVATPQYVHPPPQAPSPAPVPMAMPNGQGMPPQQQQHQHPHQHQHQQQLMHAHAQAQAMQQRAQQSLQAHQFDAHSHAQAQSIAAQQAQVAQAQAHAQNQHGPSPVPVPVNGNGQALSHQQLQQAQANAMAQTAQNMYSSLGLGAVNPSIMHHSAQSLGLAGRDVTQMSEDERVSSGFRSQYVTPSLFASFEIGLAGLEVDTNLSLNSLRNTGTQCKRTNDAQC